MTSKKTLSLIQLVSASDLVGKSDQLEVMMQLAALYNAPTDAVIKARKDPAALDPFLDQAAGMDPSDVAEVVADFLGQYTTYHSKLRACLEAKGLTKTPAPADQTLPPAQEKAPASGS